MAKERTGPSWEIGEEEARRLFPLTPDDLYFFRTTRVEAQRLYPALVLLWTRVERVLLSDTEHIPDVVIAQVSKQLGLAPSVLSQLRNPPMMRAATFEAVRTHLGVHAFQETDEKDLQTYLMEKVTQTSNYEVLFSSAMDWLTREGIS